MTNQLTHTLHDRQACALAVRRHIIDMCSGPEGGHLGGSMSSVEILVELFFGTLTLDPSDTENVNRDVFILSKGHAAMALYSTLAERGFIQHDEVATYCQPGSRLATHANPAVPGVEFATGSLGHGLALANGTAFVQRKAGTQFRTFVLIGDGELQEGSVWEAAHVARSMHAHNLVAVIDLNGFQQTGAVSEVSGGSPVADRWGGFGWNTIEIDGHDFEQISRAFEAAKCSDAPTAVICRTIKGRGAGLLTGRAASHFVQLDVDKRRRILAVIERSNGSSFPTPASVRV